MTSDETRLLSGRLDLYNGVSRPNELGLYERQLRQRRTASSRYTADKRLGHLNSAHGRYQQLANNSRYTI